MVGLCMIIGQSVISCPQYSLLNIKSLGTQLSKLNMLCIVSMAISHSSDKYSVITNSHTDRAMETCYIHMRSVQLVKHHSLVDVHVYCSGFHSSKPLDMSVVYAFNLSVILSFPNRKPCFSTELDLN